MTNIDKNDAEAINAKYGLSAIEKRLDEAAKEHHERIDTGFVSVDHHHPAFKAGTRYGIEWVIEYLASADAYEKCVRGTQGTGNFVSHSEWADHIRKHFAPILERGRDAGTQN